MKKWDEITKEELYELAVIQDQPDYLISELYGVSKGQVRYKRRKFGITRYSYGDVLNEIDKKLQENNPASREFLLDEAKIDRISKGLTHFIFRYGPVEDMHAAGQLSQKDMMTLNKYMVNRLAGILSIAHQGQWMKLELLYRKHLLYGGDWDKAEPDTDYIEMLYTDAIKTFAKGDVPYYFKIDEKDEE